MSVGSLLGEYPVCPETTVLKGKEVGNKISL